MLLLFYVSKSTQSAVHNGFIPPMAITIGVPQGSELDHPLFCFFNDFSDSIECSNLLFTNDMKIHIHRLTAYVDVG